ncbi:MAG: hypothetical protein IT406_00745 [Candidatus Yanofskybacteria bacterium]|nr:hypothetical protein [Candidatus Yanofskybacteria bacterium]
MGFFVYEHSWCPTEYTLERLFTVADSRERAAEIMVGFIRAKLGRDPLRGFNVSELVEPWLGFQRTKASELANTLAMYGFTFVDPSPRPVAMKSVPQRVEALMGR